MKKTMVLFLIYLSVVATSCMKTYTCVCTDSTSNKIISTVEVEAKNANDASSDCIFYENDSTNCIIHQPK